jgi:hypothetical protein
MAEHDFTFFVTDAYSFQPPLYSGGATRACIVRENLFLRRMDDLENRFVPGGTYRESWVIFPNWKASGIQDLYGFEVGATFSGSDRSDTYGGAIYFQLSNDDGTTWWFHNGSYWDLAGSGDWNTKEEIDFHIPSFPLTDQKQVRLKMNLVPGRNGKDTPLVHYVRIYTDIDFGLNNDLLLSMKSWVEQYVWVRAHYFGQIPQPVSDPSGESCGYDVDGPSDVLYVTDKRWDEMSGPAEVYNLTTDPNRTTNLFAGFTSGGILLTSPQEGYIESAFMARPKVFLSAEEFMEFSVLPSIVVQLTSVKERRDLRLGNSVNNYARARNKARVAFSRVWFDAEMRISCQSDLHAEATLMSDAVNEALSYHRFVMSLATGDTMPIPYDTPITPASRIMQGLYVREYACTLFSKIWLRRDAVVERDLAQEIRFLVHPFSPGVAEVLPYSSENVEVP